MGINVRHFDGLDYLVIIRNLPLTIYIFNGYKIFYCVPNYYMTRVTVLYSML